ncbi:thiamine pyrophosphate-binding protein [Micromonospora sp. NPDC005652]|uniref:thiamine pyrophosphate-binding protein n=1 Tax=Micromonospora sp. NPDC005652 TaxID=3157046 RepID=UPI0033F5FE05
MSEFIENLQMNVSSTEFALYDSLLEEFCTAGGEPDRIRCAELVACGPDAARRQARSVLESLAPGSAELDRLAGKLVDEVLSWQVRLSGAEAVAVVLAAHGVATVFAYAGTSELALCDAFEEVAGVQLVNGRGDRESAFMAGGASALVPNRGAALLHGARGLTNAAGALADVRRNEFGVVYVVGLPSTSSAKFLPPHGEPDLIANLSAFAGYAWECGAVPEASTEQDAHAVEFVARLREALETAARPPFGPSLFGVPQDVAEERWIGLAALADGGALPTTVGSVGDRARTDALMDDAVAALRSASRPFILVDDFALRYEGIREALSDLARTCGAAVAQLRYRRGPMLFERIQQHEVENFIGWLNQYSTVHAEMLASADLLITVEDRNMYRRLTGELPTCRKIAINSDPAKVLKNSYLRPDGLLMKGQPAEILARMAAAADSAFGRRAAWFPSTARMVGGVTPDPPSTQVEYGRRAVTTELVNVLRRWTRPVLVDDSQMFGGLLSDWYEAFPPGLRVVGGHGGFVGCGMSYAVGLAIGDPSVRVMCTLGDQGFTNAYQVLVAAHQQRARVLFVVCNNGESVSLRKQARSSLGERRRDFLANVSGFSYTGVAAAHGVQARRLHVPIGADADVVDSTMADLAQLLAKLTSVDGPSLLELVLPSDVEAWRGIWLAGGFDQEAPEQVETGSYSEIAP